MKRTITLVRNKIRKKWFSLTFSTIFNFRVNPITGCLDNPSTVNPFANMTEEQKEYEAVKLVNPFLLWIIWTIKISSKPYIYQFVAEIH